MTPWLIVAVFAGAAAYYRARALRAERILTALLDDARRNGGVPMEVLCEIDTARFEYGALPELRAEEGI